MGTLCFHISCFAQFVQGPLKERNGGYWYEIISISHVNVIRESRAKSMQAARVTKPEIGDGNSILFNLVSSPCCPPFFLADDKAPSVTGCPDPIKVNLPQGNNSEVASVAACDARARGQ